jgi:hypothetical protein
MRDRVEGIDQRDRAIFGEYQNGSWETAILYEARHLDPRVSRHQSTPVKPPDQYIREMSTRADDPGRP